MKCSKKGIAIELSKLETFNTQKVRVEQYSTDSEIAASMIWEAYLANNIENKTILDLGAGTGILGLGTMFFNPIKVTFIELDKDAIIQLKNNLKKIKKTIKIPPKTEIINKNIKEIDDIKADTLIMNPPFGTKQKHADKEFLLKAFELSNNIYTLHKSETKNYLIELAHKNNFSTKRIIDFSYPLKNTLRHHKSRMKMINVSMFHFEK